MNVERFIEPFKGLGFEIKPSLGYYTPDSYAWNLMQRDLQKPAVSYSDRTNYTGEKKENDKK